MKTLLSVVLFFLVAGLTACGNGSVKDAVHKNELVEVLKSDNWLILPLPDTKMGPGTVIFFRDGDLRYLGDLKECGVAPSVFDPVRGQSPDISASRSFNVDLGFSLNLIGVPAGADASLAKEAVLQIDDAGADDLSLIRLRIWLADPNNKLEDACSAFFEEGAALLSSAYRITSGSIELKKGSGASATLSDIEVGKAVDLDAKGSIKNVSDGKITFADADYYIAFKRVVPLDGIQFLGGPEDAANKNLDDEIRNWINED